jgi:hypothetical protein
MTAAALDLIPASRRDAVFAEIRQLVTEVDAIDRSLAGIGEGWCIDDALSEIVIKLNAEIRQARKRRKLAASKYMGLEAI